MRHQITRVVASTSLVAALVGSVMNPASAASDSEGEWNHMLAPLFLWGMSIDGESQLGPVTTPLQINFTDAISDMEAVFTFHYEANKGDLTLIGEYQYIALAPSAEIPGGPNVDISFKNQMGELDVAYRVAGTETVDWEILGGVRYTKQKLKMSVGGVFEPVNVNESWTVGVIGGRVIADLPNNWRFAGRIDWGTGGSDNTQWNIAALFDWRFKEWGSLFLGYRWMDYDYDNGKRGKDHYAYKATQQGPQMGVAIYW